MPKSVIAVSIANINNTRLLDLDQSTIQGKVILIFSSRYESSNASIKLLAKQAKAKDLMIVDVEDFDYDILDELHKLTQAEINDVCGLSALGKSQYNVNYPTPENIKPVYNFIKKYANYDFIVGCSAGISRTGALVKFMTKCVPDPWQLNNQFNTSFCCCQPILDYLKTAQKEDCKLTVKVL